ncbi:hypothetical protein M9H77_29535 [Catharanthus roseus]|uniref:Uncharacterized protein n=1 Tax=Catharanthus roseus TaxID=4058 RepID=A0ACB9ZUQ8_CATRO|nr:hypothetical protein M9H77_29535 [Catharanthus roseus]
MEGLARSVLYQISHHALRWDGRLVESQEGLEIKVGLRMDLIRALVKFLVGADYEIPELVSDDIVMGFGLCIVLGSAQVFGTCSLVPRGMLVPYSVAVYLIEGLGVYKEGIFVGGSNGATSSSSYSLREIIPKRDPVLVVDLSDGESIEGPAAQGVKFWVLIEDDPSMPESDLEMIWGCGYKIPGFWMTELLEPSMATRRNERVPATGADEVLERFLKFRPPEFFGEVEQEIKAEIFLEQF